DFAGIDELLAIEVSYSLQRLSRGVCVFDSSERLIGSLSGLRALTVALGLRIQAADRCSGAFYVKGNVFAVVCVNRLAFLNFGVNLAINLDSFKLHGVDSLAIRPLICASHPANEKRPRLIRARARKWLK